jgi:hypothetical protein
MRFNYHHRADLSLSKSALAASMPMGVSVGHAVSALRRGHAIRALERTLTCAAGLVQIRPSVTVGVAHVGAAAEPHHQERSAYEQRERDEDIERHGRSPVNEN